MDVDKFLLSRPDLTRRVCGSWDKLKELVTTRPYGVHRVLEIGTYTGATTLRLLEWCPDAHVHTINCNKQELEKAKDLIQEWGHSMRTSYYLGDSLHCLATTRLREISRWDIVLIDGLHTYAHTMAEYFAVRDRMDTHGLIIFDDVDRKDPNDTKHGDPGVPQTAKFLAALPGWTRHKNLGWFRGAGL